MLRLLTLLAGMVFIILSVLGMLQQLTFNGKLLGVLTNTLSNNFFHLGLGLVALLAFLQKTKMCKIFFLLMGSLGLLLSAYYFYSPESSLFALLPLGFSDAIFYAALGILFLYIAVHYRKV